MMAPPLRECIMSEKEADPFSFKLNYCLYVRRKGAAQPKAPFLLHHHPLLILARPRLVLILISFRRLPVFVARCLIIINAASSRQQRVPHSFILNCD